MQRIVVLGIVALLTACGSSPTSLLGNSGTTGKYDARVRWTELGIPHIEAKDWPSMGYGMGYAFAEDNLCDFLEDIATIRGERSRYFGRNGPTYTIRANGANASNVNSDFFWKHVATDKIIADLLAAQSETVISAVTGYADGVSRYVRELKAGEHPGRHIRCADEEWLQEIDINDMGRRILRLSVLASSSVFVNEIGSIQPPSIDTVTNLLSSNDPRSTSQLNTEQLVALGEASGVFDEFPFSRELGIGSNMYALGEEATQDGKPLQFVNPHFPWFGTERLHLSHLKLDGDTPDLQAEMMGVSLHGAPAILIGFNRHLAWSHTVSTAYRFTVYELTLVPGAPTSYIYDGAVREMEATEYTIDVMEDNGSITQQTRTLYRTHYGPMMNLHLQGELGAFNWTPAFGYAIRDANAENTQLMENFFRWNKAKSLTEFQQVQEELVAVPWVNTTATGPGEQAYYSDVTRVPNVPDSMVAPGACANSPLNVALGQLAPGLPVLDGNRSDCEWKTDPDSPQEGVFGASNLPKLRRDDWVHNCNDSYWLTNPAEPITGFAAIIGNEDAERSLRTRKCILHVQQRLDGTDGRDGTKFTRENLKEIVLASEIHTEELARADVLAAYCDNNPTGFLLGSSGPVDVSQACAVLAAWDGTTNINSVGGHVWREFWRDAGGATGSPWLQQYSSGDPVNTPNTINFLHPEVEAAFADAVGTLQDAGVALDAKLGDIQWTERNGERIPIFGDSGSVGAFTIAQASLKDDGSGYGPIFHGNSYVQVVGWDDQGNPEADAFITYSQSTDATSDHFGDFTREYSAKRWKRLPFTEAQIASETIRDIRLTE